MNSSAQPSLIAPPSLRLAMGESLAAFEWASAQGMPFWQLWADAPRGDGHAVLVLPGLVTDDAGTAPLRQVLGQLGHEVVPWGQGVNRGPAPEVMKALMALLEATFKRTGRPVSLVGWSMGGAMAYALAAQRPAAVRQVITLAAPFSGDFGSTRAADAYAKISGSQGEGNADLERLLRKSPKAPITAITTRQDGVVAWPAALVNRGAQHENLLVRTTHWGLPANAQTIWVVANRLALPEGTWAPYAPQTDDSGWLPDTEIV